MTKTTNAKTTNAKTTKAKTTTMATMKQRALFGAVAALILTVAGAAAAAGKGDAEGTRVQPEGTRVEARFPGGWKDLPDLAKGVAEAMFATSNAIHGGVRAFGDVRAGHFGVLLWVTTKDKVSRVRPELQAFLDSMKSTMTAGGMTLDKWEEGEDARRRWVDFAGQQGPARIVGRAVGVVDKGGFVHGYALQCVWTGKDASAKACQGLLGTLSLTWKDDELRPLEKRK